MRKISYLFFLLLVNIGVLAQAVQQWERKYYGESHLDDYGYHIATDASGNVYISGTSCAGLLCDIYTIKYNALGDTLWMRIYPAVAGSNNKVNAMAIDSLGNVYITGKVYVSASNKYDYITIKYDASGNILWTKLFNGPLSGIDGATDIALDGSGNAYVTGDVEYTTSSDIALCTIKYDSNGDTLWVKIFQTLPFSIINPFIVYDNSGFVYLTSSNSANGYNTIKQSAITGDTIWVRTYWSSTSGPEIPVSIKSDGIGNIYVTGVSDFDKDYLTIKYNSNGDSLWVRRYDHYLSNDDAPSAMAVDDSGNVYVTGYNYSPSPNDQFLTIKYDSSGNQQWVRTYNSTGGGIDRAADIILDGAGDILVAGRSSGGTYDYAVVKYNSAGVQQWAQTYDNGDNDYGYAVAVDSAGNVFVTGTSKTVLTAYSDYDYYTIKYNASGVQQWGARFSVTPGTRDDHINDMKVDNAGNVYVTGYSDSRSNSDYCTIKYNTNGDTLWVRRYNSSHDSHEHANAIAIDNAGNVYVTGGSYTGPGGSGLNYLTIKYNINGDTVWTRYYHSFSYYSDVAFAIAVDDSGNVYVTGQTNVASGSGEAVVTIKYNSNGIQQWVRNYFGTGSSSGPNDKPAAIAVDMAHNVYVTGYVLNNSTGTDYFTIKYNTAGVQQWVRTYNYSGNVNDIARDIALDGMGYAYVTGVSDWVMCTIKYDSAGNTVWEKRFPGLTYLSIADPVTRSIKVDNSGNIIVVGERVVNPNYYFTTIKYNSNGDTLWSRNYNLSSNYAGGKALAIDGADNVYVTGQANTYYFNYPTMTTIKYNANGVQQWVINDSTHTMGNNANAIGLDGAGNVYVAGHKIHYRTGKDYCTIKYSQLLTETEEISVQTTWEIIMFPNPVSSELIINFSKAARYNVQLYNTIGEMIEQRQTNATMLTLEMKNRPDGIYFIAVIDESGNRITKKIVKM